MWILVAVAYAVVMLASDTGLTEDTNEVEVVELEAAEEFIERPAEADEGPSHIAAATHRQSETLKPDGGRISTFCLDAEGRVIAAVGDAVVAMSASGDVLFRTGLDFRPTAVNVDPDGTLLAAGTGRLARLSSSGEVLATASAPHIGDPEEFREKAIAAAREAAEERVEMYRRMVEQIDEQVAKLEEKPEADRTAVDNARLEAMRSRRDSYGSMLEVPDDDAIERRVGSYMTITAVATNGRDVFLSARKLKGYGYAVWRTDYAFADGVKIIDSVGGCCGQMDLQCAGDRVVLAENTSFKVGLYDRDGQSVDSFGKQDRSSKEGFGACCNPMNVRPLADGSILTAESSIGHIKRFGADGEFVGYVGKAEIGGGCKHCAVDYDPKTDRYYMLNTSTNAICVLASIESLGSFEEDPEITALHETFDARLAGTWTLDVPADADEVPANGMIDVSKPLARTVGFGADGTVALEGGLSAQLDGFDWVWTPKESDGPDAVTLTLACNQTEAGTLTVSWTEGEPDSAEFLFKMFNARSEPIAATRAADASCGTDGAACDKAEGEACDADAAESCPSEDAPAETDQPVAAIN